MERVRSVEGAVLKTVAPSSVSKVRVLGAPPSFARMVQKQHARFSTGKPRSITGCGCHFFIRPIAQKESGRLTSGRPRSITSSGDHHFSIPP